MSDMTLAITGAGGFIGRHVVNEALRRGHRVVVLTTKPGNLNFPPQVSVLDWSTPSHELTGVLKCQNDLRMIHLAWAGLPDYSPQISYENVLIAQRLLELAVESDCGRLVGVGSCWEHAVKIDHGDAPWDLDSTHAFTMAKLAIKLIMALRLHQRATEFVWVRPFYVYGPGQRSASLLPSILESIRKKEPVNLRMPDATHDFVHVRDVAEGLVRMAESSGIQGEFDLGFGRAYRVSDLAAWLIATSSAQSPARLYPQSGLTANVSRIAQALNWTPGTTLEDGLLSLIRQSQPRFGG